MQPETPQADSTMRANVRRRQQGADHHVVATKSVKADGDNTERRRGGKTAGDSGCGRSGSRNGRDESIGAHGRPAIPFRLLLISPWELRFGCSGAGSANVVGVRLGLRDGYQRLV